MKQRIVGWSSAMLVTVLLAGCASSGPRSDRPDPTRLTAAELSGVEVLNLYEAVNRLRPRWLEVRSVRSAFGGGADGGIVVYLDRTRLGGVDELRQFSPGEVALLEYLTGSEAAGRLPGIHSANIEGAIVIHLRIQQ